MKRNKMLEACVLDTGYIPMSYKLLSRAELCLLPSLTLQPLPPCQDKRQKMATEPRRSGLNKRVALIPRKSRK